MKQVVLKCDQKLTGKLPVEPPVEAALVVTYLQFTFQVCFPCIGQYVTDTASVTVTDTIRVWRRAQITHKFGKTTLQRAVVYDLLTIQ